MLTFSTIVSNFKITINYEINMKMHSLINIAYVRPSGYHTTCLRNQEKLCQ